MEPVINHARLAQIGDELFDRSRSGTLAFADFQRLFHEALSICGPNSDHMEMFCAFAKLENWWEWMMKELQKSSSQRVA